VLGGEKSDFSGFGEFKNDKSGVKNDKNRVKNDKNRVEKTIKTE